MNTRIAHAVARIFAMTLVASCVTPSLAFAADTGEIVGSVIDGKTKKPIANATIAAVSPSDRYKTKTDAKGVFEISNVTADTYIVSAEAQGYFPQQIVGATVLPGQSYRADIALTVGRTIVTVQARGITSAYQPSQPIDEYNLGADQISTFVGKDFNTSGQQLLSTLPSVTIDRSGTPLIRGGFGFELGYDVEGIDYREPSASLTNRFENFGNSDSINGVGNVEIVPGGGDATHGDTGTGLISITIKRGTQKPFTTFDLEGDDLGDFRQIGLEDSRWLTKNGDVTNYFSYVASHTTFQYGENGILPGSIGASPITTDPNASSNLDANTGSLYTTSYFNAATQGINDVIDNLVLKIGPKKQQSLQLFMEQQIYEEHLNYGGLNGVTFASPFPSGLGLGGTAAGNGFGPIGQIYAGLPAAALQNQIARVYPQFPYGSPGTPLDQPDTVRSPFVAFKVDFRSPIGQFASVDTKYYRTINSQSDYLGEQGIYSPQTGGLRTGLISDFARSLDNGKQYLQFGGKYEFAHPDGTTFDTTDYSPAFSGLGINTGALQISTSSQTDIVPDFVAPQPVSYVNGLPAAGTPGCNGTALAGGVLQTHGLNCGYLARFFPTGRIPSIPAEAEEPTANEQNYALYLQDTFSPNARFKALFGARLEGYNFILPTDPDNPPALDGLRQQRQLEPHVGLTYQFGKRNAVRANFGSTLSIPLPTFLGLDIDQNAYSAFANIPSYDNSKGPFDPSRPQATQADYCGPGVPQTTVAGTTVVQGTQPCANYGQQLYYLYRNYRFGLQSLFKFPLRASTFTNYDFSYSHDFTGGLSARLTPFYRRGYNIVETSRTLLGWDPQSEVADLSPAVYSNGGNQTASGIEFYLIKTAGAPVGPNASSLSYQLSATYVNQIGNDPPGTYLPTPSVQLGELYPSPDLARFQTTLGISYKTSFGLRFNPILALRTGYPYGAGGSEALYYGNLNEPIYVPLTNAIANGLIPNYCQGNYSSLCLPVAGSVVSNGSVDPQNPGTIANPNIIASRGTEGVSSNAGSLTSATNLNLNLYVQYSPPASRMVYGVSITNLFNEIADVPVVNDADFLIPVYGGAYYSTGRSTGTSPTHGSPTAIGSSTSPYIIYPNQTPVQLRAYVQVKL